LHIKAIGVVISTFETLSENGLLNGTRLVYYHNGEKHVDETYQFKMVTGLVKNYYEDDKLLSESYYRGKRQHGLYTSYYPNGKILLSQMVRSRNRASEYRKFGVTRQCGSIGTGGYDASMKCCLSSSGCESRRAQGEPARAGSQPCDGARNGLGDAQAGERAGHGACGPATYIHPGCSGS
jgi:hypothetical protein